MKTIKTALAYVLLLAMLLSPFGGYARAAGEQTVPVGEQLVFDPLAGTQSVAYERHADGYAVSLDRSPDCVTMDVAAVPGKAAAEGASLFIRTGVTPEAGKTYRVSYTLGAKRAVDEYVICFDGAAENAYGAAETRSVPAGGADPARFLLTPTADSGELILRLLLGKTAVNTFTFSDLTVEEATEDEIAVGANTVLVDRLNLNAPGSVSMWANDDCKAKLTTEGETATLTVTDVPESGAEVWKIKLFVNTGVMPEAGKTYRFRADVTASASRIIEICYNEGDVEKGYAVLYNQSMSSGQHTMSRLIYIPREKENAGELVFQLSLGKLQKGDTVTIGNISVEEMIPAYRSALAEDFALDATWEYKSYDSNSLVVTGATAVPTAINWDGKAWAERAGDHALDPVCTASAASMTVKETSMDPWHAMLHIHTGETLEASSDYRVTLKVTSTLDNPEYNIQFGSGKNGDTWDNDVAFGGLYARTLAANTPVTETYQFSTGDSDSELLITLQAGKAPGSVVTASDVRIEKLTEGTPQAAAASVEYPSGAPSNGSFANRDGKGSLSGDGASAVFTRGDGDGWQNGLFVNGVCPLESGKKYLVSYTIAFEEGDRWFKAVFANSEQTKYDGFADAAHEANGAYTEEITAPDDGSLYIFFELGAATEGKTVTLSDVRVVELASAVIYPTSAEEKGSFENRDGRGALSGDGASAVYIRDDNANDDWQCGLFVNSICDVKGGQSYTVRYDIAAAKDAHYKLTYHHQNKWEGDGEDGCYWRYIEEEGYEDTVIPSADGSLTLRFDLGEAAAGTEITVSNITVTRQVSDVDYPTAADTGSFENRDGRGALSGSGASAVYTRDDNANDDWQCGLFVNDVCAVQSGKKYVVSYDIQSDRDETRFFAANYNHSEDRRCEQDDGRGEHDLTNVKTTFTDEITAAGDGRLYLRFDLGAVSAGANVTVSNITVKEMALVPSGEPMAVSFGSVSTETHDGFTATLTRNADSVVMDVAKPDGSDPATWKAKLCIRTGVSYEEGKNYRVSFDVEAARSQSDFCVITRGVSDKEDIRGTWSQSLSAGVKKTVTTRPIPAGKGSGALDIDIELGKLNGDGNTYTVSNVRVEEVVGRMAVREAKTAGTVENDAQPGYSAPLTRAADSATVSIDKTPDTGMEAWKSKLFVNTDVSITEGETCLVRMDVLAENDMDYEVCYNCGGLEKGFDAVYGLHAEGGKARTVERLFTAERSGQLTLQLSLGNVSAPNAVTVSNVTVEKATYTSGGSALSEPLAFRGSSAVSCWAHADYTTRLTGTDDAITVNILKAPVFGAEPWKIKLFLDTETPLKAGRFYRVTTDLLAKSPQNVEICYNNGGAEMGYDAQGGVRLAAGVPQTVEKLIAVPADKTDLKNLMLQINLGAATSPNEVTVSGVTVEEVSLRYTDLLAQGYSYQSHSSVWTTPDFNAKLDATSSTATICVTDAPATGAEVWKAKLFVRTGVVLAAGKSYVVRANLVSEKDLTYELCFNNEETEKGFDVLYGQFARANETAAIDKKISVPASMTDAGELVLQFSVGGPGANNVTVANVSVQELRYGANGARDLTPAAAVGTRGRAALNVSRDHLTASLSGADDALRIVGAALCSGENYTVSFTGKADRTVSGTLTLRAAGTSEAAMSQRFELGAEAKALSFTTAEPLNAGGACELLWQLDGAAQLELSNVRLSIPAEQLTVTRSGQKLMVNGKATDADAYNINGYNYFKLRDLALLLNDTDAQFVVRYNAQSRTVSLTTGKRYTPVGGELVRDGDRSATCTRGIQELLVNGEAVRLKAYNLGNNNYFKLRDLGDILGFHTDYIEETDTAVITSPMTPEAQEASYACGTFFRPEIDGESQPHVGDPMAFYEDGVYYIYYLKEGGDSINHSVYLTTTTDFASYTEYDAPVLSASRGDAQDSWIGTGSVTKVDGTYYFFYTGFNASGAQEYHEKIMVAKSDNLTSFEKVSGWEITPPASIGQKNDFRDPQAYYDPATGTISLTVTASQGGVARILKYTLSKDMTDARYDGIIFTDPTAKYWNLECSDTFRLGDKWYLTYSGQEDTLWYATAKSRFGPYSAPVQLDGRLFYAAKHVENGSDSYMVGWARRSESASSTQEVSGWGGNLTVQKLTQRADGSLALVPVDGVAASFNKPAAVSAESISLSALSDYSFKQVCTGAESFKLTGEFTYTGTGSFGLAFDFNGSESSYKLVSVNPAESSLSLAFNKGVTKIAETPARLGTKHSFTYMQDGSVGIFYVDGVAALTVRIYGSTGKPVYLFAQNNSVSFTSLRCFTK